MEKIKQALRRQEKKLLRMKKIALDQLAVLPEGRLKIRVRKGKAEYHIVHPDGKEVYLRKDQKQLCCELAKKTYLKNFIKDLSKQLEVIQHFLNNYSIEAFTSAYHNLSNERKKLITPIYLTDDQYLEEWNSQPYQGKGFAVNDTEILTEKGERVRSKSEKIIADKLFMMGIPYKYECPLRLGWGGVVYPDFTLLNVKERKEIYLEHLGMMDSPEYAEKATRKINSYIKNDIVPGDNLILTYETSRVGLDMKVLERLLESVN